MTRRAFEERAVCAVGNSVGIHDGETSRPLRMERRGVALLAVALLSAAFALATPSGALAGYTHPFVSSFGSFSKVQGIAVDSSTGDVLVYDGQAGEVLKFDASGVPAEFASTKTHAIRVESSCCGEGQIAVDNSSGPAKGDIYLAHAGGSIDIFNAAGESLGELTGEGAPWGEACGVAVDVSGNVYVGLYPEHIDKFVPTGSPVTNADYASSIMGAHEVCNVGADSLGNAYSVTWGDGPVTRFEASQFGSLSATGSVVDALSSTVAVDPASDEVYVDEFSQISQFGPHGEPFEQPVGVFGGGEGEASVEFSRALAVSGFNHEVYAANNLQGKVLVFGPGVVLPDVVTGEASSVAMESATVSGTVNPDGVAVTECKVEYGLTSSYGQSQACAQSPAEIGAGPSPVPVEAQLANLSGGSVYHYRLVAVNANGASRGADQTLKTSGPSISAEAVSNALFTEADVTARINPNAESTTFHVEYGPSSSYGASTPESAPIGSDNSEHVVSTRITGLTPGTTYHFRFVATNSAGSTRGADATFATYPSPSATDTCPNAQLRALQAATYLPDCRAYEMASPPEKNGVNVATEETFTQSSIDGNAVKWMTNAPFGDAVGSEVHGAEYVSQRGSDGWSTHSINPRQTLIDKPVELYDTQEFEYFSADLTKGVFYALSPIGSGHPNVEGVPNLYLRTDVLSAPPPGTYELLSDSVAPLTPNHNTESSLETRFVAASADMSRITFESVYELTPEAAGTNPLLPKLYEWHNGVVKLAGILPNNSAAEGSAGGQGAGLRASGGGAWSTETMSSDGSRIVFTAAPFSPTEDDVENHAGDLYMRIDGTETVKINASERLEPDPNGAQPATFWKATSTESHVFFTSRAALTDDATPAPGGEAKYVHFYRYDLEAPVGKRLTLLAQGELKPLEPAVMAIAAINGVSADGSYVYLTFNSPLREGDPEFGGLYVWHNGALRYLVPHRKYYTSLPEAWGESTRCCHNAFRVTPDGKTILFASVEPETAKQAGYSNVVEANEVYAYDYDSGKLTCASCNPSGAPPAGRGATFTTNAALGDSIDTYPASFFMATTMYLTHALSDDGRYAFFDTAESLVPDDTNGQRDVYEYDLSTGQVHLISGGTCNCKSAFVDASADGRDVFFTTHQSLVRADRDTSGDVYDARIEGGIASQNTAPTEPCESDDCQGPAKTAPSFSAPASSTFVGSSNPVAASKSKSSSHRLTRAQKLAQALRKCKSKRGRRRSRCQALARKRYGALRSGKRTSRRAGR
jgi:hypothetical protein